MNADLELFIRQLINGLNTGSIYALIAIGYTMVYGIIKLINFAHGEIMMFGAYFAFLFATTIPTDLPFVVIVIMAMVLAALMGVATEKIAYKRLRTAPRISALITAIGMSLFLQNLALLIFKPQPKVMPELISKKTVVIFGMGVPQITLYTIGISILMMIILSIFIKKTKAGKAMRAVSQDKDAAMLMGINVDGIISLTFAIGSALGALGGVFYSIAYTQVYPTMGVMPGLKAFIAAVFGGIGNIGGAMLGGYTIGIIETMTKGYISSRWADALVFGILILVLLFKPSGILGKNVKEKV
ncbi:MAG: branched-chain amino acid ABC transporter permease [Candidatus Izimaplasma sp.]|nr:branched-chain amino acid ABC transporter permease [Candidatus Izimaplasma bacterium]